MRKRESMRAQICAHGWLLPKNRFQTVALLAGAASLILPFGLAHADDFREWPESNDGYAVTLSTGGGIPQSVGSSPEITGQIMRVEPSGQTESSTLQELKARHVEAHFYYPDLTTDISSQVTLSKTLSFTYTGAPLSGPATLTVKLVHVNPDVRELQDQLNDASSEIAKDQGQITSLQSEKSSASVLAKIAALKLEVTALQAKEAYLHFRIGDSSHLIAQNQLPLQVGNQVAGPAQTILVLSGFQITSTSSVGSAITGETSQFTAQIQDLHRDPHSRTISVSALWNGVKVAPAQEPVAISPGHPANVVFTTPKLSSSAQNQWSVQVSEFLTDEDQDPKADRDRNAPRAGRPLATLSAAVPVAADHVAPVWTITSPKASDAYVKQMEPISATLSDPFGLVDPTQIRVTLGGQDITSELSITSPDQGQTYVVTGNPQPPEGNYTLSFSGQDLAGNPSTAANGSPATVSFEVDHTPPVVTLGLKDGLLTNQASQDLPVSVQANAPTTTVVFLNGAQVFSSQATSFSAPLTLLEGVNQVQVIATDLAGNVSQPAVLSSLTLDTVPPVLSIQSPSAQYLGTRTVALSGSADKALRGAWVDGTPLTLSSDQWSFTGSTVADADGPLTLSWQIQDLAGNITNQTQTVTIDSTPPVVSVGLKTPILTNQPALGFPITFQDIAPVTVTVKLNGSSVSTLTQSGASASVTLAPGANTIEVDAVNAAGLSAEPQVFTGITLDQTPPQLSSLQPASGSSVGSLTFSLSGQSSKPLASASVNGTSLALSPDHLSFSGSLTVSNYGPLSLQWSATDLAGNTTRQSTTLTVGSVPSILLGIQDGILTNQPALSIPVSIQSDPTATTTVSQNGSQIYSGTSNSFVVNATLSPGLNTFQVQSSNSVGSAAPVSLSNVVLDQTPPQLASLTPSADAVANSLTFAVSGQANKPLKFAKVNGQLLPLSKDGTGFSGSYVVTSDAVFGLNWEISDLAGNTVYSSYLIQIDLGNIKPTVPTTPPSIYLGVQDGITTNTTTFLLPVSILSALPTTTTVLQNGTPIFDAGANTGFYVSAQLTPGVNTFEVDCTDSGGNLCTPAKLSNIVLDQTPPVLSHLLPINNGSVASTVFSVSGLSNKPLASLLLNGRALTLGANSTSFTGQLGAGGTGTLGLVWEATDLAGNVTVQSTTVHVGGTGQTLSGPGPTITLGVANGFLTHQSQLSIPVTVSDAYATSSIVTVNGQTVLTTTQPQFTVTAPLKQSIAPPACTLEAGCNPQVCFLALQLTQQPPGTPGGLQCPPPPNCDPRLYTNGAQPPSSCSPYYQTQIVPNVVQIQSVDSQGLASVPTQINVLLQQFAPPISNLSPAAPLLSPNGGATQYSILSALQFPVSGVSAEPLTSATLNGQALSLSSDGMAFYGTYTVSQDGIYNLNWALTDAAGNLTTSEYPVIVQSTPPVQITPPFIAVQEGSVLNLSSPSATLHVTITDPGVSTATSVSWTQPVQMGQGQVIPLLETTASSFTLVLGNQPGSLSPLGNGQNIITIQSQDGSGNSSQSQVAINVVPDTTIQLSQPTPYEVLSTQSIPISGFLPYGGSLPGLTDTLQSVTATINGQSTDLSVNGYNFTGSVPVSADGSYTVQILATGSLGNHARASVPVIVQSSSAVSSVLPSIQLGLSSPVLLPAPTVKLMNPGSFVSVALPVTVTDGLPTVTTITVNSQVVYATTDQNFTYTLDGTGFQQTFSPQYGVVYGGSVVVSSRDDAGNSSSTPPVPILMGLNPPVLSQLAPLPNTVFTSPSIPISGQSSAPLTSVTVNGQPLTLASNGMSFSGSYTGTDESINELTVVATDAFGNQTTAETNVVVNTGLNPTSTPPTITLSVADGQVTALSPLPAHAAILSGTTASTTISLNGQSILTTSATSIAFSLNLMEGANLLQVTSTNTTGTLASSSATRTIYLDTIPPEISLGVQDGVFTTQMAFAIPVTIQDASSTTTRISHNGVPVYQTSSKSFTYPATLAEGVNTFSVSSQDAAGNISAAATLNSIILDHVPPVLSEVEPTNGAELTSSTFSVSGISDKPLSALTVNGQTLTLSSDGMEFEGNYTISSAGTYPLSFTATDLAGNTSTLQETITLSPQSTSTTPVPVLSNLTPVSGANENSSTFVVSGQSSLPLLEVTVNGKALTLSSDLQSFVGNYTVPAQGANTLTWTATAMNGQVTTQTVPITVEPTTMTSNFEVDSAVVDFTNTALNPISISGRFSGLALEGAQTVNLSLGSFSTTIPVSSFWTNGTTATYSAINPTFGQMELKLDFTANTFDLLINQFTVNSLSDPLSVGISYARRRAGA